MSLKVLKKYKNPLFLISLFIINFMWFFKMGSHFHVLMGDDLAAWNSFEQGTSFLSKALLNTDGQKYRPVWNLIQYVLFKLFNSKYQLFF
ncbi:hypothetical protein EHS13_28110 [Paenibacillus psychroresistens]|uniref:Uncharacterized protein n=1 Tax=Paenibacillus psychroresistens TaxID=1778678 RepID=A0A6B8RQ23_9BACL|nr:hypothetical protein [Paenibacillus psychroresistens]QGQ98470.1 hypothetical protein EHS13_28110 [Paenibacillus psychroresistens]